MAITKEHLAAVVCAYGDILLGNGLSALTRPSQLSPRTRVAMVKAIVELNEADGAAPDRPVLVAGCLIVIEPPDLIKDRPLGIRHFVNIGDALDKEIFDVKQLGAAVITSVPIREAVRC